MRVTMNGKHITLEEARERIAELIPNGGRQYLDNTIESCKEAGLGTLTLTIGTKGTLEIEF